MRAFLWKVVTAGKSSEQGGGASEAYLVGHLADVSSQELIVALCRTYVTPRSGRKSVCWHI